MKPTEIAPSDYVTTYGSVTTKGFITAGKDQNGFQIALSFFATSMGARAVTFPAYYASYAGWLGLLFYALSCGGPIMLVALIGPSVRRRWPEACSLGDFIHYRYNPILFPLTCAASARPPRQISHPTLSRKSPHALRRFGPTAKVFVSCIVVFNMAMAMLAEYMAIGAIFRDFVGSTIYPLISTTALLSLVALPAASESAVAR